MALSFKDQYGANAFWQLIQEYQRKYAITVPAAEGILFYFEYKVPNPTPNNLQIFLAELQEIPEQQRHQRLVSIFLTKRDLLPKLVTVFKQIDQSQEIIALELMFKIIKLIFNSSNEELLYELMCNESFMSVVGALQYDPNFKNHRPRHRQFMRNQSRLLEVVPFTKNPQLLNLVIFTYRLQYVRQCILFAYLNDYSFNYTNYIIKGNYRKILNQIFNPKKKDFINNLFDLLRIQDVNSFKLLREIFRIAKMLYLNEIYSSIAERDFFEIMIRNMKQFAVIELERKEIKQISEKIQKEQNSNNIINNTITSTSHSTFNSTSTTLKYKKKKPQQIQQIVGICFEILKQFMEFEPYHFRNYCVSQKQKIMKYPTFNFLFDQFEGTGNKIGEILRILIGTQQPEEIKMLAHQKTITNMLIYSNKPDKLMKWLSIFSKIVQPYNNFVNEKIQELIDILLDNLQKVNKNDQITLLTTLKSLIHIYINTEMKIKQILQPKLDKILKYFLFNKGSFGIRISTYFSIFHLKKYVGLTQKITIQLIKKIENYPLMQRYLNILKGFSNRYEVELPKSLKRQSTMQPFKDEQSFDKLQKKVKIE